MGNDTLFGGDGDDTYVVNTVNDIVFELDAEGADTVQSAVSWTLGAHFENLTLTGTLAINATGNEDDNVLIGNAAKNVLTGGLGNDTYVVTSGDTVAEAEDEGTDTVQSAINWILGDNLENLTLTGTGAVTGTGNALDNTLTGNAGINILDGGLGADAMSGGRGNDTYIVDNIGDTVMEGESGTLGGADLVKSSVSFELSANVENLTLTGTDDIDGTGNELANKLLGNASQNTLNGGLGKDALTGGAGGGHLRLRYGAQRHQHRHDHGLLARGRPDRAGSRHILRTGRYGRPGCGRLPRQCDRQCRGCRRSHYLRNGYRQALL